jgi:hypothetical protein
VLVKHVSLTSVIFHVGGQIRGVMPEARNLLARHNSAYWRTASHEGSLFMDDLPPE